MSTQLLKLQLTILQIKMMADKRLVGSLQQRHKTFFDLKICPDKEETVAMMSFLIQILRRVSVTNVKSYKSFRDKWVVKLRNLDHNYIFSNFRMNNSNKIWNKEIKRYITWKIWLISYKNKI